MLFVFCGRCCQNFWNMFMTIIDTLHWETLIPDSADCWSAIRGVSSPMNEVSMKDPRSHEPTTSSNLAIMRPKMTKWCRLHSRWSTSQRAYFGAKFRAGRASNPCGSADCSGMVTSELEEQCLPWHVMSHTVIDFGLVQNTMILKHWFGRLDWSYVLYRQV